MKNRFILYRRKLGGMFYVQDTKTRKQESLAQKFAPKPRPCSMPAMKLPGNRN